MRRLIFLGLVSFFSVGKTVAQEKKKTVYSKKTYLVEADREKRLATTELFDRSGRIVAKYQYPGSSSSWVDLERRFYGEDVDSSRKRRWNGRDPVRRVEIIKRK